SSSFMRISNWSRVMPALLTRIERPPRSFTIVSINPSTAAPSVTFNTRPSPPCADSRCVMACAPASEVAVPITFAPCAASSSAIAAPMPRVAPVTSAISPCSNPLIRYLPKSLWTRIKADQSRFSASIRFHPCRKSLLAINERCPQLDGCAERARIDGFVDALAQAGQHLAGTAFEDLRGAVLHQRLHGVCPQHRHVQLALERRTDELDAGMRLGVGVLQHRNGRHLP